MHRRTRKILIFLFVAAALVAVAYAVQLSLNPDHYFFRRPGDRAGWVYDPGNVALVCSLMLAEAVLACIALVARHPQGLWLRCLLGLVFLGPWALFSTMFVVHMPGYTLFHHLWVWLLVVVLAVVALGSMTRQLYARLRRKGPPNNSFKPKPLRGSA